ncbi:Zinc transporter ZupT [Seminavis robusta]|uniref:Zinc transporter ZupT n=1 Tax=Seminavis robusta TaxID=568900 RepID=A0A9N8DR41_9STRA|nr:Zinc transporter ZupT [Seminavis robusta]|eukprot:Sro228_g092670.1 Zinc transporter ZupT (410) ;mRNA; r:44163-45392
MVEIVSVIQNDRHDESLNLMPLYMSTIAGMSTCLGAVWVLFQKRPTRGRRSSNEPVIQPSTMCFSLALAGSVMVTVSVVSIIPECLRDDDYDGDDKYRMIPLWSMTALIRMACHILGYVLYFLLAKFAFPEPDEILGLHARDSSMIDTIIDTELANELLLEESCTHDPVDNKVTIKEVPTTSSTTTSTTPGKLSPVRTAARNRRMEKGTAAAAAVVVSIPPVPPTKEKPDFFRHLSRLSSGADLESTESRRAWRVAMLLFLSLSVHNFPEGLAVAASAMESPQLGWKVCIGIMIHNIPEGISIAVPCMAARPDSPWLAFGLSALSGLAEPFGAFVAMFALRDIGNDGVEAGLWFNMENVLAFVAGIMIMVAVAELFPEALRHTSQGKFHFVAGTLAGVLLMLATELYLE